MDYAKELMTQNWMIMDIEYIQTSKKHQRIRKIYMLSKNGSTEYELDFYPCVRYKNLSKKYQRAFTFLSEIHPQTFIQSRKIFAILFQHSEGNQ